MIYITHIRLSINGYQHEHITDLKWRNPDNGSTGQHTRAEVVKFIRDGGAVRVQDARGEVEVCVVESTPPYLRTKANGYFTDNLLSLPRF